MKCLMKRLMITLVGALAFTAAVQAAEPQGGAASDKPTAVQDEAKKHAVNDAHCLRHTGTRITSRADNRKMRTCSAIGRSYTREDLDRTGEVNLADALRKLDPAVY